MEELERSVSPSAIPLNPELARVVGETFHFAPDVLLEDLVPSPRIFGIGATERDVVLLRRGVAREKYPEWYTFWEDRHRKVQFAQFLKSMNRVYAYIRGEKRKEWEAGGNDPHEFMYRPTVGDLRQLSVETIADIKYISLETANFIKTAFGDPEDVLS